MPGNRAFPACAGSSARLSADGAFAAPVAPAVTHNPPPLHVRARKGNHINKRRMALFIDDLSREAGRPMDMIIDRGAPPRQATVAVCCRVDKMLWF